MKTRRRRSPTGVRAPRRVRRVAKALPKQIHLQVSHEMHTFIVHSNGKRRNIGKYIRALIAAVMVSEGYDPGIERDIDKPEPDHS